MKVYQKPILIVDTYLSSSILQSVSNPIKKVGEDDTSGQVIAN